MSLFAPVAVPVEIRGPDRRVFRLSRLVGDVGLRLVRPAPFEPGRPVTVALTLPVTDRPAPLVLRALVELVDDDGEGETGGRALTFVDPPSEARAAVAHYLAERLGLSK